MLVVDAQHILGTGAQTDAGVLLPVGLETEDLTQLEASAFGDQLAHQPAGPGGGELFGVTGE